MKKRTISTLLAATAAISAISLNSAAGLFVYGNHEQKEAELNEKYVNATELLDTVKGIKQAGCYKDLCGLWITDDPISDGSWFCGERIIPDYFLICLKENAPDLAAELTEELGYSDKVKIYDRTEAFRSPTTYLQLDFLTDDHELNRMIAEKAASIIKNNGYSAYKSGTLGLSINNVQIEKFRISMPWYPVSTIDERKALTPADSEKYNRILEDNGIRVRYREVPEAVEFDTQTVYEYAIFPEDMTVQEMLEYALFAEQNFGVTAEVYALASSEMTQLTDVFDGEISYMAGDTNEDGKVTIADAAAILQYLGNSDKYPLSQQAIFNADIDSNGLTTADAVYIQKICAGL